MKITISLVYLINKMNHAIGLYSYSHSRRTTISLHAVFTDINCNSLISVSLIVSPTTRYCKKTEDFLSCQGHTFYKHSYYNIYMLLLILFLILASVIGFVALQNTTPVTITLGTYIWHDIPLFMVIVISNLFGLLLAYVFYLAKSFTSGLKIRTKNKTIQDKDEHILTPNKKVHQLELNNKDLRDELVKDSDDKSM